MLSCHLRVVIGVGRKEEEEEGSEGGWMACEMVLAIVAVGWTGGTMVVMVVEEEEGEGLTAVLVRAVDCVGTSNERRKLQQQEQQQYLHTWYRAFT